MMTKKTSFTLGICLLALASCGKENSSRSNVALKSEVHKRPVLIGEKVDKGVYRAVLAPVNGSINASPSGQFTVVIDDKTIMVEAEVSGVHPGIKHYQAIHAGASCPSEEADANFDGIIDAEEGAAYFGPLLIPLDNNLHSQIEGMSYGPIANEEHYYFYRKTASFSSFYEDLTGEDHDPEDSLIKLEKGEKIRLDEKVVVVYGVSPDTELSGTVSASDEKSQHESLPVACGRFIRLTAEE